MSIVDDLHFLRGLHFGLPLLNLASEGAYALGGPPQLDVLLRDEDPRGFRVLFPSSWKAVLYIPSGQIFVFVLLVSCNPFYLLLFEGGCSASTTWLVVRSSGAGLELFELHSPLI